MRIQSRISLIKAEVGDLLEQLGIRAEVVHGDPIVHVYTDDVRYQRMMEEVRTRGFHFTELKKRVFEKEEMEAGEFYHMISRAQWGYPEPQDDWKRRLYDESAACKSCGKGAKQVRPFTVAGVPKFGRGDLVAMFWVYEYIVTERLKEILESADLTGAEFWHIVRSSTHGEGHPIKGAWQLYITSALPPMSPRVKFPPARLPHEAPPCLCGRIGRNWPESQIRYKRSDLALARDFNKTREWLGGGLDTAQLKIVSRRVYDLFIKNKITGADFEPIVIEE